MFQSISELIQNNDTVLLVLGIVAVISFVATLVIIPWIIVELPGDYFAKPNRDSLISQKLPKPVRILLLLLKNLFGCCIVILGIMLLVLPGQGLLTILIGLILIDFPGKYQMQRALIRRKTILSSVNWLREHSGKSALQIDPG